MLLIMMFCTMFFILPAVGMILLAIKKMNKERREMERFYFFDEEQVAREKKQKGAARVVFPAFVNKRIIDYQLIDSQIQESLHFREVKPRAPCRDGP